MVINRFYAPRHKGAKFTARQQMSAVLIRAAPVDPVTRVRSMSGLADALTVTRQEVSRWITQQRIPPHRVAQLIELSKASGGGDTLKAADLMPWVS